MKFFKLSFDTAIWRFYLMMIATLVPFFIGIPYLALVAAPIFLSIMLGISIEMSSDQNIVNNDQHLLYNISKAA